MMLRTSARTREADVAAATGPDVSVAFQPFVTLDGGELCGAEALARFPKLPTARVMREAELAGCSEAVDLAVLRHTVAQLADEPGGPPSVHVNVSCASLRGVSYLWSVQALLHDDPDVARRVIFDVTETTPLPAARIVRRFAAAVRSTGARLSVDDVPVGYDRMHAISLLSPDVIKLDGATLRRSLEDRTERIRLEAVALMARDRGAILIAEGIESGAHVDAALDLGATVGQGYLLGEPRICDLGEIRPFQRA